MSKTPYIASIIHAFLVLFVRACFSWHGHMRVVESLVSAALLVIFDCFVAKPQQFPLYYKRQPITHKMKKPTLRLVMLIAEFLSCEKKTWERESIVADDLLSTRDRRFEKWP